MVPDEQPAARYSRPRQAPVQRGEMSVDVLPRADACTAAAAAGRGSIVIASTPTIPREARPVGIARVRRRHARRAVRLPADREPRRHLYDLVADYPQRGGRGLRPSLCIATARAFGAPIEAAIHTAVSIELMHNAMLIHDDIEDESEQRRGTPTMHVPPTACRSRSTSATCSRCCRCGRCSTTAHVSGTSSRCASSRRRSAWRASRRKGRRSSWAGGATTSSTSSRPTICDGAQEDLLARDDPSVPRRRADRHRRRLRCSTASSASAFSLAPRSRSRTTCSTSSATRGVRQGARRRHPRGQAHADAHPPVRAGHAGRARATARDARTAARRRSQRDVRWVRERMDAYGCIDYARQVAHGLAGAAQHEFTHAVPTPARFARQALHRGAADLGHRAELARGNMPHALRRTPPDAQVRRPAGKLLAPAQAARSRSRTCRRASSRCAPTSTRCSASATTT